MNKRALLATIGVFFGCCFAIVFLECLVTYDPGMGNVITFAQFAFIALEGFIFTSKFGTVKRKIAIKNYALLVVLFFSTSLSNNYAFNLNIPMPLHMIFRSGSLISNMITGAIILKRRYQIKQYIYVILITIGIFICTYYSSAHNTQYISNPNDIENNDKFYWILGIAMLMITLLVSSYMGIRQEIMYRNYGKHAREALYYTHLLPLPGFLFLLKDLRTHLHTIMASEKYALPVLAYFNLNVTLPVAVLYLIGNVLMQYLCISSVYILTTECTSLTVTLVLTLRKFVSLVFSIIYFRNSFTLYHWLGTFFVFLGTCLFIDNAFRFQPNTQVKPNIVNVKKIK